VIGVDFVKVATSGDGSGAGNAREPGRMTTDFGG
jgi:hypothetical protein